MVECVSQHTPKTLAFSNAEMVLDWRFVQLECARSQSDDNPGGKVVLHDAATKLANRLERIDT